MSQEQEREFLFIPDDEGNEEKFEIIYEFEVEDKRYILVTPADTTGDEEEAEVYAFRFEEDGQDMKLYPIEDEEEWDLVEEVFNTLDYEFNQ
ncbi:DUF1292 domain-containing protein [Tepidibacillus fermentans]|uniref:UPF0473 protein EDD72_103131 n=1 Tax=Tepidibacillus fermentans TaxID=1281767 RepID=A0A4R3KJE3_9BACI|nr:DUF1292 domain-containing protein [Tepidibacillus fermentans]TCS83806.1 uncharacterized protein YrzB (UPF0473 family) [Tepidibacillus fermentans]